VGRAERGGVEAGQRHPGAGRRAVEAEAPALGPEQG
jgi:hypothetical protein